MNKEQIDDKTTLKASTIEQEDDAKEHSESLVTQSIDPSNAAARFTQEDNNLDRGHEARQRQEAGSIMIGTTIPRITTTIEKNPRTSISTTSNFATTSSSTTTNPSAFPGSNKGKGDSTSSSLEDDPHNTRRGPPEDVFVVDDADKGDEHDDSHSKDDEAATKSQDLLIDEEEEKDRKRIERNKRERMLSKQRGQLKADKNKLMTNQIQKLQQENAELRQKIEDLSDELSVLIPPDQVEIVRQKLSMHGTM